MLPDPFYLLAMNWTEWALWGAGGLVGVVLILFAIYSMFRSFYQKVDQGFALINNTMSQTPKVTFTGMLVIPIIHRTEVMDISVKTIQVDRRGKDGLICADNVRADITVAFYVRVNKTAEDVLQVASAVGVKRASDQKTLEELFQAKFSEALKTVGKQLEFVALYNERQNFKEMILKTIGRDLNGYSLEDTAIDYLEQTPIEFLDDENILDAEGKRKIIELTASRKMAANAIQVEAEKVIKKQNVEGREAILALERQQAEAEAIQARDIAVVRAREQAEVDKVQAEQARRAQEARILAEQESGVQRHNANREIEIAEKNRQRAVLVETERVEKERQLEMINRERATDLSRIEKEKAIEVERKAIADVIRERVAVEKSVAQEEERIKDLRATMTAEREKSVAVTQASQSAEQERIKQVVHAEAEATAAVHAAKQKLTLADAEQAAAEKHAIAEMRLAEAQQARAAADGLAAARVKEADAVATEKQGLAAARVKEADAHAVEMQGVAAAKVKEADAAAIEKQGVAEANSVQAKMSAEATGIAEKAESMKLLNESTRAHEEFRLRLEKDFAIAKEQVLAEVQIAERNALLLGDALKNARFDIVGGDGAFFDRFVKAITLGKTMDAAVERSQTLQLATKDYAEGSRSLPADLTAILSNPRLGSGDVKDLAAAALLAKIGQDPAKAKSLLDKARELGFGDELSGWLTGAKG